MAGHMAHSCTPVQPCLVPRPKKEPAPDFYRRLQYNHPLHGFLTGGLQKQAGALHTQRLPSQKATSKHPFAMSLPLFCVTSPPSLNL